MPDEADNTVEKLTKTKQQPDKKVVVISNTVEKWCSCTKKVTLEHATGGGGGRAKRICGVRLQADETVIAARCSKSIEEDLGRVFLFVCLFLAYSGLVYAAGRRKKPKKHTEHERVQFLGTTEHERRPYTHAMRQKHTLEGAVLSTTEHERVPYTHATRCTQRYKSTYTH